MLLPAEHGAVVKRGISLKSKRCPAMPPQIRRKWHHHARNLEPIQPANRIAPRHHDTRSRSSPVGRIYGNVAVVPHACRLDGYRSRFAFRPGRNAV